MKWFYPVSLLSERNPPCGLAWDYKWPGLSADVWRAVIPASNLCKHVKTVVTQLLFCLNIQSKVNVRHFTKELGWTKGKQKKQKSRHNRSSWQRPRGRTVCVGRGKRSCCCAARQKERRNFSHTRESTPSGTLSATGEDTVCGRCLPDACALFCHIDFCLIRAPLYTKK